MGDARAPAAARGKRLVEAGVLGLLLALHFLTRLHAQHAMPLGERHFYPLSYLVSLSLVEGRGFGYLLPAAWTLEAVWKDPLPPRGDPAYPVLAFLRLEGPERVTAAELAAYVRAGARVVPVDAVESTRVLDIRLAAWLWRLFGVSWPVYFAFYALLSTATCAALYLIASRAAGRCWVGLAAAAGFAASPLEAYAGAWSTRDTVPLWITALAFAALAAFASRPHGARANAAAAFGLGCASLVGLGWRPDFQLVPPLLLAGLVAALRVRRAPLSQLAAAVLAFGAGCAGVLLLLRALGPGAYDQGRVVFHVAWYGETTRSNLLRTENAFQVVRDDKETLYQANYFARSRFEEGQAAAAIHDVKDPAHHRRCRAMYEELARYHAFDWWSAFPGFLARAARIDQPSSLLGSSDELASFRERRPGWAKPMLQRLDRYGSLLPVLAALGLVGGLLDSRSRLLSAALGTFYAVYAAVVLLVLPETKHFLPLLLPLHVGAALGLWSLARAAGSWSLLPGLAWSSRRTLAAGALAAAALAVAWAGLGVLAHRESLRQRARLLDEVRRLAQAGSRPVELAAGAKRFTAQAAPQASERVGYLLRVRATRPSDLLCLHVRSAAEKDGSLAYFTRHPVEPGADRLFFFNVVAGRASADPRPYTAHVRLVGPAQLVSAQELDLSRYELGLPLSLLFDVDDRGTGATRLGADAVATEGLADLSLVPKLLEDPSAFLASVRATE
jgi:hypothetical protein